ncbi:hypothetical protein RU59_00018 [Enterobacter phage phiEap-1]|uniref:Uncharacterized protein n=1 Tax=Enterobacter phage phiEap-1 TaxID=1587520 RepID=A0A0K2FHF6_9CAUD|nr:hypothetical protein RU59_00018 [Enterobacter phage phiEap-1]ALA45081.1 hypothetical protein RU59_00018 [Enterobacter phage phiEap-1]
MEILPMRKPEEIRAEIDKLVKELDAVKVHESKRDAACHILTNLGWTHSPQKGWQKPEPKRDWKEFDSNSMTHIKAGDWVLIDALVPTLGGNVKCGAYVRKTSGNRVVVSPVVGASTRGAHVSEMRIEVSTSNCRVVPMTIAAGRLFTR